MAHIYPHSPTDSEKELLKDVPKLSDDPESIENLIIDDFTIQSFIHLYSCFVDKQIFVALD